MIAFVDTSALYALLDADDDNHKKADAAWLKLLDHEYSLLTSNYVLVESFALLQHRLGLAAVRTFQNDILPLIQIEWVAAEIHAAAVSSLLTAGRKSLSLVDCVSFEVMRRQGLVMAFAFDSDFTDQGYQLVK